MNSAMFMTIKGSTQGLISDDAFTPDSVGNIYQNGHENEIFIKSYSLGSSTPVDPSTNYPTGRRTNSPLSLVKLIDKSSPLLYEAHSKGETLINVQLRAYRTSYAGKQEHFYTIALKDARIINIHSSSSEESAPIEHISLSYRRLELRHEVSSTSSHDDTRTGVTD